MIVTEGVRVRRRKALEELQAPLADVLGATVRQTLDFGIVGAYRAAEVEGASDQPSPFQAEFGIEQTYPAVTIEDGRTRLQERVSAEDARAKAKEAGVDLTIPDDGVPSRALDLLIEGKRRERRIEDVLNRAPRGIVPGALRVGTALATSLLDPLNVAAAFVPVVGEARYAAMLARAGGALGRTGVRAGVGAAEGAVGSLLVEPATAAAQSRLQADYDATDALLNIAVGTALGGGLHIGVGALGDVLGGGNWRAFRPTEGTPALVDGLPAETRVAMLRTAVGQAAAGRVVEVSPLALLRDDLMGGTSLDRRVEIPVEPEVPFPVRRSAPQPAEAGAAPEPNMVPVVDNAGVAVSFPTEREARAAAAKRSTKDRITVEPLPDGRYGLFRDTPAEFVRAPDGRPETFATRRAAERFIQQTKRDGATAVPLGEPGDIRWAVVQGGSERDRAAMASFPDLVRVGDRANTRRQRRTPTPEAMRMIEDAARAVVRPESIRVADFAAAKEAAETYANLAAEEGIEEITEQVSDAVSAVRDLARALELDDAVKAEMKALDDLIDTADAYGRAVQAAAACGIRRS